MAAERRAGVLGGRRYADGDEGAKVVHPAWTMMVQRKVGTDVTGAPLTCKHAQSADLGQAHKAEITSLITSFDLQA